MNKEPANRDSSESKFHNHCPPLGKAVPSQWALPGRSSIFRPFGKKTRPNDRLSCGEGFAGPVKLLLAAAELNSGWSVEGVKEKSKWNHFLPLESLFLCTHVAFRQRKSHALKMGNLTYLLWQASISGEIHPVEEGLSSRERSGVFLGSAGWVPGWFCASPSTSQRPFGGADAEQGWCDSTDSPTFHSRSQVWIDCVISYHCSSYRWSHWAWHLSLLHLVTSVPCLWQLQPLCALLIQDVSLLTSTRISLPGILSQSQLYLSIICQSCLTSLYLPFPGPFMTLNDFPASSPDFLLWSR